MKNAILNSIAAVSLASVSYFSTINSASAATLVGQFQFDGADAPNTTITLSQNSFTFDPNPGQFNIKNNSATGTFVGFTKATINGPVSVPGNSGPNPFFDLGTGLGGDLTDNKNIFNISLVDNYSFTLNAITGLYAGSVGFKGIFTGNNNTEVSDGAGLLTFQLTSAQKTSFDRGNRLTNVAFSGVSIAAAAKPVPESSSLLGLLGLGVVGAVAVTRKSKKVEM
jgi:hypothetical protein